MARDKVQVDVVTNTQGSQKSLLKYAVAVAGATVAVKKLVDVGKVLVSAASGQQEIYSKFNVVFKQNATAVQGWARQYSRAMGRSTTDTIEFLSTLQDTFVPLGFARDAAADMSMQVVELANDLASFNNMDTETVVRDLQSALVGNTETLRKYGVVASQAAIEQYALQEGLWDGTGAMDAQTKAAAVLALTLAGTADAQGDLARTQDSFANVSKAIQSAFKEIRESAGGAIMEAITPMATALRDWLYENLDTIQVIFANIPEIIGIAFEAGAAIGRKALSWEGFSQIIIALANGLAKNIASAWKAAMGIAGALWVGIKGIITSLGAYTIGVFSNAWANVKNFAVDKLSGIFEFFGFEVEQDVVPAIGTFGDAWDGAMDAAAESIKGVATAVAEGVGEYASNTEDAAREVSSVFSKELGDAQDKIDQLIESSKEAAGVMGDVGGDGDTGGVTEATAALENYRASAEATAEMERSLAEATERQNEAMRIQKERSEELAEVFIGSMTEAFGVLGEAISNSSMGWRDFAKAAVMSISAVLDAVAEQQLVLAFAAFGNPGIMAKHIAAAALAKVAAGVVKGMAGQIGEGHQFGGDFVVPPGYENDAFPMRVNSGERVTVTPKSEVQSSMGGGDGSTMVFSGDFYLYGAGGRDEFIEMVSTRQRELREQGAIA